MTHLLQTNTKGFDDLVFDQRNQAYGAYVLRREYPTNVLKSLLISVAVFASILLIPYLAIWLHKEVKKAIITYTETPTLVDYHEDDPVEPPPTIDPEPPGGSTAAFLIPVIVTELNLTDSSTTLEDLTDLQPGYKNQFGPGEGFGDPEDNGERDSLVDITFKEYPIAILERQPSFPGGEEGLFKFLSENLVYPEHAKTIHLEGKVNVIFVIDEFGNVTKPMVPREKGGGLDEEALRVVKMMPRWSPGYYKGRPVKVAFQLPIVFQLD